MNGFEANPEGLMTKGTHVNEIFQNYLAQKNAVYKTTEEVRNAWAGADSAGYVTAIHGYEADFQKLAQIIEQMGDILYRHGARLADSRDAIQSAASKL